MLIVITPEIDLENEAALVNELFQFGLVCLHVRKPNKNTVELMKYIEDVDIQYRKKIVLHNHHELALAFDLKGVHFTEMNRLAQPDLEKHICKFSGKGLTVSASFHDKNEIDENAIFNYVFLSPVFDSISKSGYNGQQYDVKNLNSTIIALGGITKDNVSTAKNLGFKGVATLGSIWMGKNPIEAFSTIKESYHEVVSNE